jgi:ABC-type amino acid transport system permease subunit
MKEFFQDFKDEFILNFVDGNMWKWLVDGLKNTLIITFFSLIIGVVIGIIVASIRSTFDKNREVYRRRGGFFYYFQWCINALANVYLTVIRGTPVVVQLLISYFIIFSSSRNGIGIAIFAFGLNSARTLPRSSAAVLWLSTTDSSRQADRSASTIFRR